MRPEDLIAGLSQQDPKIRMRAAYLLGTLQETASLTALRIAYDNERDEDARTAIKWAGKRVKKANVAGYDTVQAMFSFFGIERAIQSMVTPKEARMLERIQYDNEMRKLNDTKRGLGGKTARNAVLGSLMGPMGVTLGAMSAMSRPVEQSDTRRFNLMYTPPREPTRDDIKEPLRILASDMDAKNRQEAVMELFRINNLAALPHLAQSFVEDIAPDVQNDAERIAKQLYWNATHWRMHMENIIDRAIEKRAHELGKLDDPQQEPTRPEPELKEPNPDEINDILRKAEEARKKRKRR